MPADPVRNDDAPLIFGHTFTDQMSGQLDAGLATVGMYEDRRSDGEYTLGRYMASFMATRAVKL